MAACMSWEGEKVREMVEARWRSYFLSVGVILPLTAVLSAAWMEVDPVSWGGGKRVGWGKKIIIKKNRMHSSGGTASPQDNKENPSKPIFALPLHKPSASL